MRADRRTTIAAEADALDCRSGRPVAALVLGAMSLALALALLAGPAFGEGGLERERTGLQVEAMLSPPLSPPVGNGPFADSTLEWFNDSGIERRFDLWCRTTDSSLWVTTGHQFIPAHGSLFVDLADGYTWYCNAYGLQASGEKAIISSNVPVMCRYAVCTVVIPIGKSAEIAHRWIADPYFIPALSPPVSPPLSPPTSGSASIEWENHSQFDVWATLYCDYEYRGPQLVPAGGRLRIETIPENAQYCRVWAPYPPRYIVWAKANAPRWCNFGGCTVLVRPNKTVKISFRPFADPFNPPPPLSPPVVKPTPTAQPTPTATPEATAKPHPTPTVMPEPAVTSEPTPRPTPTATPEPPAAADPDPTPAPAHRECTVVGTSGDDVLIGTDDDDVICGRGGNDLLIGARGNDILRGGPGDDVLRGGKGDDLLVGGGGDDVLAGNAGADRLFGKAGHDVLRGGRGGDYLSGGRGRDELRGGRSADVLMGKNGSDRLRGGPGRDVLRGGKGSDYLHGGSGTDSCMDANPMTACESIGTPAASNDGAHIR